MCPRFPILNLYDFSWGGRGGKLSDQDLDLMLLTITNIELIQVRKHNSIKEYDYRIKFEEIEDLYFSHNRLLTIDEMNIKKIEFELIDDSITNFFIFN